MSQQSITTVNNKRLFLENYPNLVNLKQTAVALRVNESTVYRWLALDKVFSQAFQELKKRIDTDRLECIEKEVYKRAMEGLSKQSDILLMFQAKALDPNKYREKPSIVPMVGDITIKLWSGVKVGGQDAVQGQREAEGIQQGKDAEGSSG